MTTYFNETTIRQYASQENWYISLGREFRRVLKKHDAAGISKKDAITTEMYDLIESLLASNTLKIADTGPIDFDVDRKPIDTLVVHHTPQPSGITKIRLNAIHLLRLYTPIFSDPSQRDQIIRRKAIYSGHVRNGRQIFWAYHWLIQTDGNVRRLLLDSETGWHAGNWDINCRSIGICLDGDFTNSSPPDDMIRAVKKLIDNYKIKGSRVLGHCEVNKTTICPGNEFTSWKAKLLDGAREL